MENVNKKSVGRFSKIVSILVVIILIVGAWYLFEGSNDTNHTKTDNEVATTTSAVGEDGGTDPFLELDSLSDKEITLFTNDLLGSLYEFYLFSEESLYEDADIVDILVDARQRIGRADSAIETMSPYLEHDNGFISSVAKGVTASGLALRATWVEVLNIGESLSDGTIDTTSVDKRVAKAISDRKDAYRLLIESTSLVGYLLFETNEGFEPDDPITYRINEEQRQILLDRIDDLFSELRESWGFIHEQTGNYNAVLFAVDGIEDAIKYDTYGDIPIE